MRAWAELRYIDEYGDTKRVCSRATGAECWRIIDKYQGVSKYWPASGCYVVRVTETVMRRPSRAPTPRERKP